MIFPAAEAENGKKLFDTIFWLKDEKEALLVVH